jgi:two-component system, NarL family, nitrate/nitrite response regulator NarL
MSPRRPGVERDCTPSRDRIRVVVVSAGRLYREGLCEILGKRERIEIVGSAAVVADVAERVGEREALPHVILVDIGGRIQAGDLRRLAEQLPGVPLVAITVPDRAGDDIIAAAESGAVGFVTQEASLDELVEVLGSAARGEVVFTPQVAAVLLRHMSSLAHERTEAGRLTDRELEILRLVDAGLSNKSIAARLCIELPTVKNHVHRIIEKLGVTNRMQAAAWLRDRSVA